MEARMIAARRRAYLQVLRRLEAVKSGDLHVKVNTCCACGNRF
jgi:hypothetical protein